MNIKRRSKLYEAVEKDISCWNKCNCFVLFVFAAYSIKVHTLYE
ncbi:hypothetical protein EUBDOL_01874 [Amedibacillus dolichus DSM 3991]|uniref:Uncharacterized protein n=1 Tax=Amedibacillus dolichus DSM 3991 TaxID=428127 RepID=A8RDA4_9FIRM|nr:hypothetical protein EUBDOL_01874 [Amedibacillus dolichus DSM 3991]